MGYPIYPNVPNVPGVPPLLRPPSSAGIPAAMMGSITGAVLTASAVTGTIYAGAALVGNGIVNGTNIIQQLSGAVGDAGTYAVDIAQNFSGAVASVFSPFSSVTSALTGDGPNLPGQSQPQQWGIYQKGAPVITADNVVSVEYKKDWNVSDYQQEQGAFASYNKVANPYTAKVQFSTGGSNQNKQDFIDSIEAIADDLKLYDVVTPERTYNNANITYNGYRRTATDGVGLLKIDVYVTEIRVTAEVGFSNTKQPAGTDASNGGTTQTTPVATIQPPQSALSSMINGPDPAPPTPNPDAPTSTPSAPSTQSSAPVSSAPIETPASQASGPAFDSTPRDASGNPINFQPTTFAQGQALQNQTQYTADPITGGTIAYNPGTNVTTSIPPGVTPQSTGFK